MSVRDDALYVRSTPAPPDGCLNVTFDEGYRLTATQPTDESDLREAVPAEPTLVADRFEPTATVDRSSSS